MARTAEASEFMSLFNQHTATGNTVVIGVGGWTYDLERSQSWWLEVLGPWPLGQQASQRARVLGLLEGGQKKKKPDVYVFPSSLFVGSCTKGMLFQES